MTTAPSLLARRLMEFCGMLEPRGCRLPALYSAFAVYSFLAICYTFAGGLVFIVLHGTPLEKLQSIGISITILNGLLKHANALFRQSKVGALFDRFDRPWGVLYQDLENRPLMDPVRQKSVKLLRIVIAMSLIIVLLNGVLPVILYFALGEDKLYFQIFMPMEGTWNFVPTHITQFVLTLHPFFTNTTHNFLYFVLSQQLTCYIAVVGRRLKEGRFNKETFQIHQEVIRLTWEMNEQFGHLLYFETKTISLECSCAAYIIYKGNVANGKWDSIGVNLTHFIFCYFIPYIICYCGSIIKSQSEEIMADSYNNEWYERTVSERKDLSLLMLASSRPLTLHYKSLAVFNMELFLGILNGTYTFLNAIVWLEKAGEKIYH